MNVLIVEDSTSARKLLRTTFEHFQCSVVEACDGQQGLEMAALHKPDVIISDALMPRMDGFQLLRALKANPRLKTIPFIFYSCTYTGEKEEELALSLGAEAFVAKPTEPEALWRVTCGVIQQRGNEAKEPDLPSVAEGDEQYLREYSRIVAAKLEEKVNQLEEALSSRARAENALRAQELELAAIFENAPFMMLLLDRELKLRRVNNIACSFSGSSITAMLGQRTGDALHCLNSLDLPAGCGSGPHCAECAIRLSVLDSFKTGQNHHQVEKKLTICGKTEEQTFTFLISTNPVAVEDQSMVLLSLHDITEHRRLEEQLRHAQRMESIGTLAGGIAHDFNNILTIIIGYGQMSLMSNPQDERLRTHLEQIIAAAERASHLTRDLLLFGRKQITDKKCVDLNDVIRNVENFLVRIIGEHIACRTHLADGQLPVFADRHQLEQVFVNLATNARDAMPKGGIFAIATQALPPGEITLDGASAQGNSCSYTLISVSDTGTGMDEQTLQHVFDPFFTTKEVGKGTGLGMSVVYGIIEQHGGFIDVSSEQGKGTTFRIFLPLTEKTPQVTELKSEVAQPGRGTETILFAEDDESVRNLTISLLERFGYNVIVAFDGVDAVEKYMQNRERIQLLLFDLVMPRKSGKQAYEEISEVDPGIKIIFASGHAPDMIQQCELTAVNRAFIAKPYAPADLLKRVRSVLDGDG